MTFEEWMNIGIENKWVEQFCYTHDVPPLTDEESQQWYEFTDDFCVPTLRVWL